MRQSKEFFDDKSPTQVDATKKRKREDGSSDAKRLKTFHKRSTDPKGSNNRDEGQVKFSMRETSRPSRSVSVGSTTPTASLKPLSPKTDQTNDGNSIKTSGKTEPSYPEFVNPRQLFESSDDERDIPTEPFIDDLAEQTVNSPSGNDPSYSLLPQYPQRLWSQCDIAKVQQAYDELDEITARIGTIMRNIKAWVGQEGFDGNDEFCSCGESERSHNIYDSYEELELNSIWKLADEEHPPVVGSDEGAVADESSDSLENE